MKLNLNAECKMNKKELHKEMIDLKRSLNYELSIPYLLSSVCGKFSDEERNLILKKRDFAQKRIPEILQLLKGA